MIWAAIVNFGLGVLGVAGKVLTALRPFAPWILAAVAGAVIYHVLPAWGVRAQVDRLEDDVATWTQSSADWQRAAAGWESSFRSSEAVRKRERTTAQAAASSLIEQCGARVEEARRSARVIERIVTREPTYDESRCPVRELVDPDSLRDALAPRSGAD